MSKSIRVLIADDELPARNKMKRLLEKMPHVEIVQVAENGIEALEGIEKHKPDMVFLDIEMPGLNGLEVVENITLKKLPTIIFATAYNEHAIKAFELNACDYLLKPFNEERLAATFEKATDGLGSGLDRDKILALRREEIVEEIKMPFANKIPVPTRDRYKLIDFKDILCVEVEDRSVRLHTHDHSYMLNQTLDAFEKKLPSDAFFRVNRSAIVSLNHVEEIIIWFGNRFKILLTNGYEVISSREKSKIIKQVLKF